MRSFVLIGLILLAMLMQATVFSFLQVAGVKPDLILMLVVFNGFLRGSKEGAFLGFLGGLAQDIFSGSYIGLNALTKMAAGYLAGLAEARFYNESVVIVSLMTFVTSVISHGANYILLYYLDIQVPAFFAILQVIIPTSIYTALLVPLTYWKFFRSNERGWLRFREP
ncbi:rod shape-determining protein MreD [Desulforamulus aquiferis]|uniref:Rod shape-determining protein MreD n=1 Tax=Desulforamulus aquiferis TaxID=1397668 RepID=A0AAW7ZA23_9FIRM|nr:rod shape-determining protein MreD [Desulforamulus aquiferis]MDO7786256.1 rod shape-determining protein MreD [Desulforamulus aquiferis]RYD01772.1 rod shape-determining protein MreD [Desulforamulus aquiferis]